MHLRQLTQIMTNCVVGGGTHLVFRVSVVAGALSERECVPPCKKMDLHKGSVCPHVSYKTLPSLAVFRKKWYIGVLHSSM